MDTSSLLSLFAKLVSSSASYLRVDQIYMHTSSQCPTCLIDVGTIPSFTHVVIDTQIFARAQWHCTGVSLIRRLS